MDNLKDEVVHGTKPGIQRIIMPLGLPIIHSKFPTLKRLAIFFDNPGVTLVAQPIIDHTHTYSVNYANHGGAFKIIRASNAVFDEAHAEIVDFFYASRPEEIFFGDNMTNLIFATNWGDLQTGRLVMNLLKDR